MTDEKPHEDRAVLRLHKRLYGAEAISLAVETVTASQAVDVQWEHAGSKSHHELVISGRRAGLAADELAQTALERTILVRKHR